jgi:hypothetical protein
MVVGLCPVVEAQVFTNTRGVGGIAIDPAGMVSEATVIQQGQLRQQILENLDALPHGLADKTEMRKVSLRRLEAATAECIRSGKPLPDEIQFLAGLQQIRFVLVYPEQRDIVLVGPAEGWRVDDRGTMVGKTTGRPVLLLDDLLVAFQAITDPNPSVISCSIDPSPEGYARLQRHAKQLRTIGNPAQTAAGIEQQLGPQLISVNGVPATSHFARVMVAADYRMKQMGMGLQRAPIAGMASFLQMAKASGSGLSNTMPRWWMEPDYQPLASDADGLTWEIRGSRVKTLSENDFYQADGSRQETGRSDPVSQKWAQNMTQRYQELALAEPVFGQLQSCMDMAIVAALVVAKDLPAKAHCELPMLTGKLSSAEFPAPKQVASRAAVMKKGRSWMIACGGVKIDPWAAVEKTEQSDEVAAIRGQATIAADAPAWWSN